MSENKRLIDMGALWLRKSKSGKTYMSGKFGNTSIQVFKNEKKTADNQPDYRITMEVEVNEAPNSNTSQAESGKNDDVPF